MKITCFTSALVVLMATSTNAFQVSSVGSSSSSALRMSSKAYEEQLRSYYGEEHLKTLEYNSENGSQPNGNASQISNTQNGAPVLTESSTTSTIMNAQPNGQYQQQYQQPPPPQPAQPQAALPPQTQAPPSPPQNMPVYVPPPPPQPVQQAPPPPVQSGAVIDVDQSSPGLPGTAIFLGLPLWLLLSVQLFGGANSPAPPVIQAPVVPPAPITQTVPANTFTLPATSAPSAANTAGVVVLSQPITKQEVRNLFELWNDALKTGDPSIVAKRYAKEGVLLPTLSDRPRYDFEGIRDYFVGFLSKKPTGKILEGEIFVGNNWAQDAGEFFLLLILIFVCLVFFSSFFFQCNPFFDT